MEKQIVITLRTDGKVDVNGPLQDKILCYGLLEVAKELVSNYKPSPIIKPIGLNGSHNPELPKN